MRLLRGTHSVKETDERSRGVGDTIARITKAVGIAPCGGCERRREALNRWLPYRQPETPRIEPVPKGDLWLPSRIDENITGEEMARLTRLHRIYVSGERRGPDARRGPADLESGRRDRRAEGRSASPSTATGASGGAASSFACGVEVTDLMKDAIKATRSAFTAWNNDKRHEACQALDSLRTGSYAWDIIHLHRQVTNDWLNKPFRPACATSGATPACGSSVTVDGTCHFAGSANYVIFGVMCRLCSDHYRAMLKKSSWYEVFDRDTYIDGVMSFNKSGMLGLIDLYKKYIPLLKGDRAASNLKAAKRWSIAGFDGWPLGVKTPPADRANCTTTCTQNASTSYKKFDVSWYPHLNPYSR